MKQVKTLKQQAEYPILAGFLKVGENYRNVENGVLVHVDDLNRESDRITFTVIDDRGLCGGLVGFQTEEDIDIFIAHYGIDDSAYMLYKKSVVAVLKESGYSGRVPDLRRHFKHSTPIYQCARIVREGKGNA